MGNLGNLICAAALVLSLAGCGPAAEQEGEASMRPEPYLMVLGVAQDASYPQAGCYRPHCMAGWEDVSLRRTATSLALIDPLTRTKYLFEATPDMPDQLFRLHQEAPDEQFEFGGVFLTHGHMGHYTGLMHFGHEVMGADRVPVFAMPRMREFLTNDGPWSQLVAYQNIALVPLEDGQSQEISGGMSVTPFIVPHRAEYTEPVGYRIEGPNKTAIFIPDIDKWERWDVNLADLIRDVDYAFIDATFFEDGEIPGRAMEDIPHPFVVESMALLEELSAEDRAKVFFIHFNHTNPLLIEGSAARAQVRDAGFGVADEGMRFDM